MEYSDLILSLFGFCAVAGTVGLVAVLFRLAATLTRFDRLTDRLEGFAPEVEKLLVQAQETLDSLERLADRVGDIAGDARAVSTVTREELVPIVRGLSASGGAALSGLTRIVALAAATKTGLAALARNGD